MNTKYNNVYLKAINQFYHMKSIKVRPKLPNNRISDKLEVISLQIVKAVMQ